MKNVLGECALFKDTLEFMITEMKKLTNPLCGTADSKCRLVDAMECSKELPIANLTLISPTDLTSLLNYQEICK